MFGFPTNYCCKLFSQNWKLGIRMLSMDSMTVASGPTGSLFVGGASGASGLVCGFGYDTGISVENESFREKLVF